MNKVLNFIRLDFITVKPYFTLKNLIIFALAPLIFIITTESSATSMGWLMIFATLYVSYPFAVGEKNGIDALYPTLSVGRSTVVTGRYLFALVFDLSTAAAAYTYSFAATTILGQAFKAGEALTTILVLLVVFSLIQAIQLPIYFKFGYARARLWTYLPFLAFPLALFAAKALLGDDPVNKIAVFIEWILANQFVAVVLGAVIWLGVILVSFQISLALYNRRDF